MEFKSRVDRSGGYTIQMLSDTDWYKVTMGQFFHHQFPAAMARYRFKCRTENVDLLPYRNEIENEIDHLCSLRHTDQELAYYATKPYIKPDYLEFLRLFQFNPKYIEIDEKEGKLDIHPNGPLSHVSPFEIYILKIVSEVYGRNNFPDADLTEARERLEYRITLIKEYSEKVGLKPTYALPITDFGGRRSFSGRWHEEVVWRMDQAGVLVGTSNPMLAMNYDLTLVGTMAHEALQAGQALGVRLVDSQKSILQKWADEYRGDLGIALSDNLGIDKFLIDFDMYFAKLFDGLRHDSGDPIEWGEKVIAHYKKMSVDPVSKLVVFSDGLNIPRAIEIMDYFRGKIKVGFGIGTDLTNDTGLFKALQLVMKMIYCNGQPVAKCPDTAGKGMCEDPEYETYLKSVIKKDVETNGLC